MSILEVAGWVVVGLFCVYVGARLIFSAFYFTQRQFEERRKNNHE